MAPASSVTPATSRAVPATAGPGVAIVGVDPGVGTPAVSAVASAAVADAPPPSMIGMLITVRTRAGKELTGELFAVAKGVAVIKEIKPHTYLLADMHMVNLAAISAVKLLGPSKDAIASSTPLPMLDLAIIEKRQSATMAKMQSELATIGEGVDPQAQALFDRLKRIMFDCTWDGQCIVVIKTVRVEQPYMVENISQSFDAPAPHIQTGADRKLKMVTDIVRRFWSEQ